MTGIRAVASRRGVGIPWSMEPDETAAMAYVSKSLRRRFPQCSPEEIDRVLAAAHHGYEGRPIRHFVPILVERDAIEALLSAHPTAPARTAVTGASPKPAPVSAAGVDVMSRV